MHILPIDASPMQLRKLRKGHNVRIKKGTGFNLIVHPENYHLASKAFAKNKGIEVKLSPEEIEANRQTSPETHAQLQETQPEMAGEGIFGKKFDRFLKKAGIKKIAYKVGDVLKPIAKKGIDMGIKAGSQALSEYAPELAPALSESGSKLSGLASDYMDHPGKYQGKGLSNYGRMGRAGVRAMDAAQASASMSGDAITARRGLIPQEGLSGMGLGGRLGHREHGSIGRGAGMIHFLPPALISQPLSANFQMSHFLPVQYQKYNDGPGMVIGAGLGGGLYGGGLYTY